MKFLNILNLNSVEVSFWHTKKWQQSSTVFLAHQKYSCQPCFLIDEFFSKFSSKSAALIRNFIPAQAEIPALRSRSVLAGAL